MFFFLLIASFLCDVIAIMLFFCPITISMYIFASLQLPPDGRIVFTQLFCYFSYAPACLCQSFYLNSFIFCYMLILFHVKFPPLSISNKYHYKNTCIQNTMYPLCFQWSFFTYSYSDFWYFYT